jgi:hypothetical protein
VNRIGGVMVSVLAKKISAIHGYIILYFHKMMMMSVLLDFLLPETTVFG